MSQATTELHHTTKKLLERLPTYRPNTGRAEWGHMCFQDKLDALLKEFHQRGSAGESLDTTKARFGMAEFPYPFYGEVINEFADMDRLYTLAVDIKKSTDRNELKVHLRNLVFRGLTTLVIGGSIMVVYWLAAELGIQLPLLRIPV